VLLVEFRNRERELFWTIHRIPFVPNFPYNYAP
jgi:hypothetical protein